MQQTVTKKKERVDWDIEPVKTIRGESYYTSDQLINAYLKGKDFQKSKDEQVFIRELTINLEKAKELATTIFSLISERKFDCKIVRLKIKDIYSFTAIFVVDSKDYCSSEFREIYESSIQLKKANNDSDTFEFSTIFTPFNDKLEEGKLRADGFTLSYNVKA